MVVEVVLEQELFTNGKTPLLEKCQRIEGCQLLLSFNNRIVVGGLFGGCLVLDRLPTPNFLIKNIGCGLGCQYLADFTKQTEPQPPSFQSVAKIWVREVR